MISMVKINVLVCWYMFLCTANITSQYYAFCVVLVSEMTYYVSSGKLNPTHSLTLFVLCLIILYSQA